MRHWILGYFVFYALSLALGGMIGFIKAGSAVSLGMGITCGSVMLFIVYGLFQDTAWVWPLSALFFLTMIAFWTMRFTSSYKLMPAGLMLLLTLFAAILCAFLWIKKTP